MKAVFNKSYACLTVAAESLIIKKNNFKYNFFFVVVIPFLPSQLRPETFQEGLEMFHYIINALKSSLEFLYLV